MPHKNKSLKKGLIAISWYNKETQTAHYYVFDIALNQKVIPEKEYRGIKTSKNCLAFLAICEAFNYSLKNRMKLKIYSSNKFVIAKAKGKCINTRQSDKRMRKMVEEAAPILFKADVEGKLRYWDLKTYGKDEFYSYSSKPMDDDCPF